MPEDLAARNRAFFICKVPRTPTVRPFFMGKGIACIFSFSIVNYRRVGAIFAQRAFHNDSYPAICTSAVYGAWPMVTFIPGIPHNKIEKRDKRNFLREREVKKPFCC